MTGTPLISVIIPNHNYDAYLGAAIDSALALEWPAVEVIVIDDGSTDRSREVIAGYGTRITAILQENSGQLVACNKGFAISRGEIVIFLDSDDLLHSALARELAAVWTPQTSKVQVQMRTIDAAGNPTGAYFPQYQIVPTADDIRAWYAATAGYPTPPGSGNAYARRFLERIFPLTDTAGSANDTYCLAAAPLLGDVLTIAQPLVSYRVHGRNQGALSRLDVHQFERQTKRARQREAYAQRLAASVGFPLATDAIDRSLHYLCYRVGSLKLAPDRHPVPGDSVRRVLADVFAALSVPQGVTLEGRLTILAWAWMVCLAPRALAARLVLWRFAPTARPPVLHGLLVKLRVLRA